MKLRAFFFSLTLLLSGTLLAQQPPEPVIEEVFRIVEDMPRFPGCEELRSKEERQKCAKKKMEDFIAINLEYPAEALDKGIEGKAVVQLMIEEDGTLTRLKVVRDPGYGLGEEALRIVQLMVGTPWTPGRQRGKPVRVQYYIPVKFEL